MNLIPSISTTVFPEELKIWRTSTGSHQALPLNTAVSETVRNQFKAWASEHALIVSKSPLLQSIAQAVRDDRTSTEERISDATEEHFCAKIEKANFRIESFTTKEVIAQNLLFIREYFELGLISEDQIVQLLSTCDEKECVLHNSAHFEQALPILDKLPYLHLICFF